MENCIQRRFFEETSLNHPTGHKLTQNLHVIMTSLHCIEDNKNKTNEMKNENKGNELLDDG